MASSSTTDSVPRSPRSVRLPLRTRARGWVRVAYKTVRAAPRLGAGMAPRVADGWGIVDSSEIGPVTAGDYAVFFGYYDKNPWSPDGRYHLAHRLRRRGDDRVEIGVFDLRDGGWRTVAESETWNLQQGSMTGWLPGGDEPRVICNDRIDGGFAARIIGLDGREQGRVPWPVQVVHPAGDRALSLNYRRLACLRPDYGYFVDAVNFPDDLPTDQDGLWMVDLRSGAADLTASLDDLAAEVEDDRVDPVMSKVNHAVFSPSGDRYVFMYRWFIDGRKTSRLYCADTATGRREVILDEEYISHYSWINEDTLVLFARPPGEASLGYFLLDVNDRRAALLPDHFGRFRDGHPSRSPVDGRLVTDSYPDRGSLQRLLVADPDGGNDRVVATLFHSPLHHGPRRCDLHPRWRADGGAISFDTLTSGRRRVMIAERTEG